MGDLGDRARMTVTTTGTGSPLTLGAATDGRQTWAQAGIQDGRPVHYVIEEPGGSPWEQCSGVLSAGGTSVTRVTIKTSNQDQNPLNLSGNAEAFIDAFADDLAAEQDWGLITGAVTLRDDYGSIT